ncbi:MAG: hypothetical protein ABI452_03200 [Candidatus Limnocylindrales bacterium]
MRDWPIVVRQARATDKDAVLEFATATWDGWDYIPQAWPVWLAATDGVMLVACRPSDDRPVAITRVAMVSPTEAWLEGIRVDPQVRGIQVASDLQVAELLWVAAQGATVLRYATSARNEGSHRLGARDGIELLFGYRNYWWSPDTDGDPHEPSGFEADIRDAATALRRRVLATLEADGRVAKSADAERLWALVSGDASFNAAQRLYEPRPWALGELTAERFARHIERDEVLTLDDRAVAILLREQLAGEDSSLRLALLVGAADSVVKLVDRIRAIVGRTLRFRLPLDSDLDTAAYDRLLGAGYRSGDWGLHILGRQIDGAHPLPGVDPDRLVLADEPRAILEPIDF